MKTTIDIADALLLEAKVLAAERQTTLRAVVEEALRDALSRAREGPPAGPARMRTFGGRGLQPGISWDDFGAVIDMAYDGRGG